MLLATGKTRLALALLLAPLVLPLLLLLFLLSKGVVHMNPGDIVHYVYSSLYAARPVIIMIYLGHLFLLLPFCLLLDYLHKCRLIYFLPGTYLLGGLANAIAYPLIDPASYVAGYATGITIITAITGATYGFFQGYLFWFMAGLHRADKVEEHAVAH